MELLANIESYLPRIIHISVLKQVLSRGTRFQKVSKNYFVTFAEIDKFLAKVMYIGSPQRLENLLDKLTYENHLANNIALRAILNFENSTIKNFLGYISPDKKVHYAIRAKCLKTFNENFKASDEYLMSFHTERLENLGFSKIAQDIAVSYAELPEIQENATIEIARSFVIKAQPQSVIGLCANLIRLYPGHVASEFLDRLSEDHNVKDKLSKSIEKHAYKLACSCDTIDKFIVEIICKYQEQYIQNHSEEGQKDITDHQASKVHSIEVSVTGDNSFAKTTDSQEYNDTQSM